MDTIYAEATPPGRGGVSILRLSGPAARRIGEDLAGPLHEARRAYLRALHDGELIDRALVLRFDSVGSFTGEDVVEFQLHGAPVVIRRVSEAVRARGARLAEPGEFMRRAFLNGQVDLSVAEAFADLLAAETELQRGQAMKVVSGTLRDWADGLRARLLRARALVEASLDFADEETPEDVPAEVFPLLEGIRADMAAELRGFPAAERIRAGFEVAIVGAPNVGKSSLLNWIARRDAALVSDIPGTTRDIVEVRTELGGMAVTFLDTAGLRDSDDPVEQMGIERARTRAADADLRILVTDESNTAYDVVRDGDIVVRSKADLGGGDISARTGEGIERLLERVRAVLSEKVAGAGIMAHRRQAEAIQDAAGLLAVTPDTAPEILAEQIRAAALRLDQLIGRMAPDDHLDEIFASFCIGK